MRKSRKKDVCLSSMERQSFYIHPVLSTLGAIRILISADVSLQCSRVETLKHFDLLFESFMILFFSLMILHGSGACPGIHMSGNPSRALLFEVRRARTSAALHGATKCKRSYPFQVVKTVGEKSKRTEKGKVYLLSGQPEARVSRACLPNNPIQSFVHFWYFFFHYDDDVEIKLCTAVSVVCHGRCVT